MIATYVNSTTFTVVGDKTATFLPNVKIRCDCGTDGYKYGTVSNRAYIAPNTSIVISGDSLTSNLVEALHGYTEPQSEAIHSHTSPADGGTLTGTPLATPKLTGWREGVQALGTLSADTTIDCAAGNVVTATIGASLTLSFSNVPASGVGGAVELWITNAGAYTVTWPTGVVWPDATAPTLTASGVDIVVLKTIDGGTSWHGAAVTGYTA